jgi:hypothetical protein
MHLSNQDLMGFYNDLSRNYSRIARALFLDHLLNRRPLFQVTNYTVLLHVNQILLCTVGKMYIQRPSLTNWPPPQNKISAALDDCVDEHIDSLP